MSDVADIARIIYDDFFKRDLLGKLGPGSLAVIAILDANQMDVFQLKVLKDHLWLLWIIALPTAYTLGLGLQILGELIGLHSGSPRPRYLLFFRTKGKWRKTNDDFDNRLSLISNAPVDQWLSTATRQRERFVVLKEASGNTALAVTVIFGCLLTGHLVGWAILSGIVALVLYITHFLHAKRQATFEVNTLRRTGILNQDEADDMLSRV